MTSTPDASRSQPSTGPGALPREGRLDATPLPRLLLELHRARWSGTLHLARPGVAKRAVIDAGHPVAAESNLASESLGVQLLDAGVIGRADYARLVETVRRRGCKEGAALLELGLVEPRQLFDALKQQVRRRLLECFAWAQGTSKLDAEARPGADLQPFRCDPLRLVRDGIAAHWPLERVLQDVAGDLDAPLRPGPHGRRVLERLSGAGAARLAETLERARTLGEAIQAAGHPEAAATAWVLLRSGGLERYTVEAASAEAETLPPEIEVVVANPDAAPAAASDAKPGPPHPPHDAAAALRHEIEERRGTIGEADHYTVLGVARQADAAAVKRAYFAAAKRFHPDALARLGLEDLRASAQQVFARIAEAHAVLSDPEQRRAYDASLGGESEAVGSRLVQAETLYRKGEVLLRAGRFGDALAYLRPAVELWPEEAEYCAALGWALYKKRPSEPEAALAQLERAAELAPRHSVVRFRLGVVKRALA